MKPSKLIIAAALSLFLCACGSSYQKVDPEQEKAIVNVMFQCLSSSPDQLDIKLKELGLKRGAHNVIPPVIMDSYSNIDFNTDYNYTDKILVGIFYTDSVVDQISYSCYLNDDTNPAAHYKLLSDQVASFGYADWSGYYEDPASEESVIRAEQGERPVSAQVAKDRDDLCGHVNNDCLHDPSTVQYYKETFLYMHEDGSKWTGMVVVGSNISRSGINEGSKGKTKDILLALALTRIQ